MTTTQDMILEAIESTFTEYGFATTIDKSYSNRGEIRPTDRVTLQPVGRIAFDFQTNYFHLYKPEIGEKLVIGKTKALAAVYFDGPLGVTVPEALTAVEQWVHQLTQENGAPE